VEQVHEEQRFRREQRDFDALFRLHYPEVVRYLASRLGSRDAAQDLASDVFLEAYRRVPLLVWRGKPILAWLY
jgi:DNA-directed RNA polymerase specialized sigma24 family protein